MGVELWLLYFFIADPLGDVLDVQDSLLKAKNYVDGVGFISAIMGGIDEQLLYLFISEAIT